MLLVIDIGNTNTTVGFFKEDNSLKTYAIETNHNKTSDEYGIILSSLLSANNIKNKVKHAVIASVVPDLEETIKLAVKNYLNIEPYCISYKSKLPFKIKLDNPKEAGADRLANAAAASIMYKLPAIVIDVGTATTFDIIDEDKNFIGGIIAPGPIIQAKALSQYTSKLPKLRLDKPKNIIGKNTIDAMLSGIIHGHFEMIKGMIKECEKELGKKANVIGTGGYSNVMFSDFRADILNKDLTLYGLKIIWELNCGE